MHLVIRYSGGVVWMGIGGQPNCGATMRSGALVVMRALQSVVSLNAMSEQISVFIGCPEHRLSGEEGRRHVGKETQGLEREACSNYRLQIRAV